MHGLQQAIRSDQERIQLPSIETVPQDQGTEEEEGKHWLNSLGMIGLENFAHMEWNGNIQRRRTLVTLGRRVQSG